MSPRGYSERAQGSATESRQKGSTMSKKNANQLAAYANRYIEAHDNHVSAEYKAKFLEMRAFAMAICPAVSDEEIEIAFENVFGINPHKQFGTTPFDDEVKDAIRGVVSQLNDVPTSAFELYNKDCDAAGIRSYQRLSSKSNEFRKVREFLADAAHDGVIKETHIMNNGRVMVRFYSTL